MLDKVCNKCDTNKLLTSEYWHRDKNKKDGFSNTCKECVKENSKRYYKKNREKLKAKSKTYYEANKEEIVEKQKQYNKANAEKISDNWKQYYQENRERLLEYQREYRELNPEKITEYKKQYYQDNKEEISEKGKQYYLDNKEKILERNKKYQEENKERIQEYLSNYRRTEHAKKLDNLRGQRRRARKSELPDTLTTDEYNKNLDHFDYKCAYCECELTPDNHHMEHVYPIFKGIYGTIKENCIPSCDSCNHSKGLKTLAEWYIWTDDYSFERLLRIHEITSGGKEWIVGGER